MESISYFKTISVRDFHFDDNDYIFIKEDLPMGQADVNVNLWLKDTKRFADLFNAILFQGKTVTSGLIIIFIPVKISLSQIMTDTRPGNI